MAKAKAHIAPSEDYCEPPRLFEVRVTTDAMSPAYDPGDRVVVSRLQPIRPGNDVLLLTDDMQTCLLRRLTRITKRHWTCKQWNPEKSKKYGRHVWPIAWRVVSVYRAHTGER